MQTPPTSLDGNKLKISLYYFLTYTESFQENHYFLFVNSIIFITKKFLFRTACCVPGSLGLITCKLDQRGKFPCYFFCINSLNDGH